MSLEHHAWQSGESPPLIRPHSLAKHRVLRAYLERYVAVLTVNPRQEQLRLTLVDGFAGGGRYLDSRTKVERPGSPFIMLEAMERAQAKAQEIRSKLFHLDVQFIFVEKKPEAFECLRAAIQASRFGPMLDDRIMLLQGDFVAHAPKISSFISKRGRANRAIYVLDQFGYSDVPLPTIRDILAMFPNAEVVLTFATDSLIDYLSDNERTQKILENVGIGLPPKAIRTAKQSREWRRLIQNALHHEIPERTGAKFYTPFFIRSADAHRDFWLIHLSGHFRARDVMVGLHWQESTAFAHYGRSGLRMLGYDQLHDPAWTGQPILPGFYFDQTALASSHQELMEQLPERLFDHRDGIEFNALFANLTNESPVTAEIMKEVLSDLKREGLIRVRDRTGTKERRGGIQHGSDVVIPSQQKRLFIP